MRPGTLRRLAACGTRGCCQQPVVPLDTLSQVGTWLLPVLAGLLLHIVSAPVGAADTVTLETQPQFILIRTAPADTVEIVALNPSEPLPADAEGMLVWKTSSGRQRWQFLNAGGTWPRDLDDEPVASSASGVVVGDIRGTGGPLIAGSLASTVQLEPLEATTLIRGSAFVTPQDGGRLLTSRPTIRRGAENGKFPPRTALLLRGATAEVIMRIPFRAGQSAVELARWSDWPAGMEQGLPAGPYTLRFEMGLEKTTFIVLDGIQRQRHWAAADSMFQLVGNRQDPLAIQFAVEHLLSHSSDEGQPVFLGDALDLIDSMTPRPVAGPLHRYRHALNEWLEHLAADPAYSGGTLAPRDPGENTGIEVIDHARQLIAAGHWSDALESLSRIESTEDDQAALRLAGLKSLYLGVILAESGPGRSQQSFDHFRRAIDVLSRLPESPQRNLDLLRVHSNAANLHLLLARNSLDNHAFQMAAGVDQPILTSLQHLMEARRLYLAAITTASQLQNQEALLGLQTSYARTGALLVDLLRTMEVPDGERPASLRNGERSTIAEAVRYATPAAEQPDAVQSITRAAARELLSQVAYREGKFELARQRAREARSDFVQLGDLSGVETMERLLGLTALASADRSGALKHFSIAMHLAELQRSRFPQDQTGQSRAGYFSRHNFIYEKLVEIHLAEDHPYEALRYAELAKARSAQDLLTTLGIADQDEQTQPRDFDDLMKNWPADVAAVEYFLGSERGWGFVIRNGTVRAFPLVDSNSQPVLTRQLIADVRQGLSGLESQRDKIVMQLRSRQGLDNSWQHSLFELRRTLLPDAILTDLRTSPRLIVIPQHILHYLPFAALVAEIDARERKLTEIAQPRFLIDEPFVITTSPSLTLWDLGCRRKYGPFHQVCAIGVATPPGEKELAGVRVDLDNLRQLYGDRLKILLEGENATESQARRLLGEPGLLMFASHGKNEPNRPTDSYLLLMPEQVTSSDGPLADDLPGDVNDGNLAAKEIFARRVNSRLVIMSACYSGLGDRSPLPGDDLFGLQRAFLYAGARSVLSGLWDVYDGTAPDLMRRFHVNLINGQLPSESLANAQRSFLNEQRNRPRSSLWVHPYFWSVFSVTGAE